MHGRRTEFYPGWPKDKASPGDYCKAPPETHPWCGEDVWNLMAPDESTCTVGGTSVHHVAEHEDGTITVSPSIVTRTYHGFLRRGVWS